jgi:catechol 2,3-dioxygenase-like lactoylglutathione lyase family enzyme
MKRLHVHVAVDDLSKSIGFYSTLFAAKPSVVKPDYAKWMLEDPRVNFAISTRGHKPGLDHLGIQVESETELGEVYQRLKQAEGPVLEEGATTCCYARSEKSWIVDPQGLAWEAFHTTGESTVYGNDVREHLNAMASACCVEAPVETKVPARASAYCGN